MRRLTLALCLVLLTVFTAVPAAAAGLTITVDGCAGLELKAASNTAISLGCVGGGNLPGPTVPPVITPPVASTCPQFSHVVRKEWEWSTPGTLRFDTYNEGRVGVDGVFIGSFVTPNIAGYEGAAVRVGYVYWPADQAAANRSMVISESEPACSLAPFEGWSRVGSTTAGLPFAYDNASPFGYATLKPNTRYFVTIANKVNGINTCPNGGCEFRVEISRSGGL